jgi:hypothetical protein
MNLFGIALRKPSFNEVTAATVMGVGLWLAVLAVARAFGHGLDIVDAGAALLVMVWGCVGVRLGIEIGKGSRHLAANLVVSAMLLAVYQGAWAIAG